MSQWKKDSGKRGGLCFVSKPYPLGGASRRGGRCAVSNRRSTNLILGLRPGIYQRRVLPECRGGCRAAAVVGASGAVCSPCGGHGRPRTIRVSSGLLRHSVDTKGYYMGTFSRQLGLVFVWHSQSTNSGLSACGCYSPHYWGVASLGG